MFTLARRYNNNHSSQTGSVVWCCCHELFKMKAEETFYEVKVTYYTHHNPEDTFFTAIKAFLMSSL